MKAKPKNRSTSGAADSRRDQMSLRQQLRKRESTSTSHREMPCQRQFPELVLGKGVVPLPQRQPGAYSAQVVEALEANEVSDDELETEYQEAMAVLTVVKQRKAGKPPSSGDHKAELDKLGQELPRAQGRRLGHGKDGHHCLAEVKRVN